MFDKFLNTSLETIETAVTRCSESMSSEKIRKICKRTPASSFHSMIHSHVLILSFAGKH